MKTAKEWAAEVVTVQRRDEPRNGTTYIIALEHGEDVHVFDDVDLAEDTAREGHAHYSGIIERLVERVQADARAPLDEETVRLRAENVRLNAEHVEYRAFIAAENDMRAEEHDQIRKANQ